MNQVKTLVHSFIHSFIYSITCLLLIANIMMDTMWSSGNTVINKMSFLFSSGSQYTGESVQRNQNFEWERSEPGIKACVCYAVLCLPWLCPTLCDPMDCSLPGPSVHIQAWVAMPSSRVSSPPRYPAVYADPFPSEPPGKPKITGMGSLSLLQGIFLSQELNWDLLYFRWIHYQLSYQGKPVCV